MINEEETLTNLQMAYDNYRIAITTSEFLEAKEPEIRSAILNILPFISSQRNVYIDLVYVVENNYCIKFKINDYIEELSYDKSVMPSETFPTFVKELIGILSKNPNEDLDNLPKFTIYKNTNKVVLNRVSSESISISSSFTDVNVGINENRIVRNYWKNLANNLLSEVEENSNEYTQEEINSLKGVIVIAKRKYENV